MVAAGEAGPCGDSFSGRVGHSLLTQPLKAVQGLGYEDEMMVAKAHLRRRRTERGSKALDLRVRVSAFL